MAFNISGLASGLDQGAQTGMNLGEQYQQIASQRNLGNSILAAMNTQNAPAQTGVQTGAPQAGAPQTGAPQGGSDPNTVPMPAPQPAQQPQQQQPQQPAQQQLPPRPSQPLVAQPRGQVQVVAQSEPNIKNQALPDRDDEYTKPTDAPAAPATEESGVRDLPAAQGNTATTVVPPQQPAQAPTQAPSQTAVTTGSPAPASQGAQPQAPAQAQQGQQGQQGGTTSFPLIDPRPLERFRQQDPALYKTILSASQEFGITPERLAAHIQIESGGQQYDKQGNLLASSAGAYGRGQLLPSTAADYSKDQQGNSMDYRDPTDNVRISANYISHLDSTLGQDSVASRAAYFAGEGNIQKIQQYAQTHSEAETEAAFPKTFHYARMMTPYNDVNTQALAGHQGTAPGAITAQGVMQSAQSGPQGLLSYLVQSKGQDVPLSDAWMSAEKALINNRVLAGDMAGVQHAHDFILSMSHAGMNQGLMDANRALAVGDSIGAAKALANSHAFFPDGAMGQFGVDQAGNVWGQRMDPANPSATIGKPFQVTQNGLMAMFNQSSDPKQYLDELYKQRQVVSSEAHMGALNDYYKDQVQARRDVAETNAKAKTDAAQTAADSRVTSADIRANGRQGLGPQAAFYKGVEKEVNDNYGPDVMPKASANDLGLLADIHTSARENGANSLRARQASLGLRDGSLKARDAGNGTYGVVDPKKPDAPPIAYISQSVVEKLTGGKAIAPPQGQGAVQIGSRPSPMNGAPTLAGTGQSSAVPQGSGVNTGSFGPPTNQQMWVQQQQAAATP